MTSLLFVTTLIPVTAEPQKYNFQIWAQRSEVYRGDPIYLAGSLCPSPPTSDNLIQVKINITKPDGSTIHFDEKSGPSCGNFMGDSELADMDGIWSAVYVADWNENNVTHTITSNILQILVKEPLFEVANVTQLSNMTNVSGTLKWDSNDKFLVFQTFSLTDPPTFSWWKINLDGSQLESVSDAKLQTLNLQKNSTQVGNMVVFSPTGGYGHGGYVYLKSSDDSYQQVLYSSKNPTPIDPAISPNGKFVAFSANNAYDNQQGIWLLELAQPIPEFPFAYLVLLTGVASLIVFHRLKSRIN